MSKKLLELDDYYITDKGEVITKHDFLVERLLSGDPINITPTEKHSDTLLYNYRIGNDKIQIWEEDDNLTGPSPETYEWTFPEKYQSIDIEYLAISRMEKMGLMSPEYQERIVEELRIMNEREMYPFIRCMLYIIDIFRKNNIVWGVGRGSSCASLVLYVLGINKIDPVKYDISMNEFFKEE